MPHVAGEFSTVTDHATSHGNLNDPAKSETKLGKTGSYDPVRSDGDRSPNEMELNVLGQRREGGKPARSRSMMHR